MKVQGTEYTFETSDLAAVTKGQSNGKPALILCYKQGLIIPIEIDDKDDLDRQYNEAVKHWKGKETWWDEKTQR